MGTSVGLAMTSDRFAVSAPGATGLRLLDAFLRDYDQLAALYNDAIVEAHVKLRPLDTAAGELPLFASFTHQGRSVRTHLLWRDGAIHAADLEIPVGDIDRIGDALTAAGIQCLAGKAVMLVTQVRLTDADEQFYIPKQCVRRDYICP